MRRAPTDTVTPAGVDGRSHGPTIRLERSTTRKNGAPTTAVITPIGISAGDEHGAGDEVGETQERAAEHGRQREDPAVAGPAREPDGVRDDDPDEADQSAHGDRGRGAERGGDDDDRGGPGAGRNPNASASSSPTAMTSSERAGEHEHDQRHDRIGQQDPTSFQPATLNRPSSQA